MPVRLTRRTALLAAAAVPLAACSAEGAGTARIADPDRLTRARAAGAERAIIAQYRATSDTHPDLATSLEPFIDRHERHLAEVLDTGPADSSGADDPSDADDPAFEAPSARAEALDVLRSAELSRADVLIEDSIASYDYALARVLASVAACESAHELLLGELR